MKSSEVSIKTRSTPASLSFKGQATKHTTVKWSITKLQLYVRCKNLMPPSRDFETISRAVKKRYGRVFQYFFLYGLVLYEMLFVHSICLRLGTDGRYSVANCAFFVHLAEPSFSR